MIIQGCQDEVIPTTPTPAHSTFLAQPDTVSILSNTSALVTVDARDADGSMIIYKSYEFTVQGGGYNEGPTPNSLIVFPIGCCSRDSIVIECTCLDSKGTKTVFTKTVYIKKESIVPERKVS